MMAALGANEEAAQQMIRDAKWENDMLKKDIGLLQEELRNLTRLYWSSSDQYERHSASTTLKNIGVEKVGKEKICGKKKRL